MQDVSLFTGTASQQNYIPYPHRTIHRFKLHHVAAANEGAHTTPFDSQPNVLPSLQSRENQRHEVTS